MAQIQLNVKLNIGTVSTDIAALKSQLETLAASLNNIQVNKSLTTQLKALASAMRAVNNAQESEIETRKLDIRERQLEINAINATTNKLKAETSARKQAAKEKENDTAALKDNNKQLAQQSGLLSKIKTAISSRIVSSIINTALSGIRSIDETLIETENTVIAIQRVLNENISSSTISRDLFELAQKYGATMKNVSYISQRFAQTGMSWADSLKASEAAILAMSVAELDATESTDGLIAILTQFKIEAEDLLGVVDRLNKVGDKFPVTSRKILAALQRTGSSAKEIGKLDLNETVGIITAMSESTGRSGENLGTALNSLINYSSKDSALNIFESVSDSVAKVVQEYRRGAANILDVWEQLGIEIQSMSDSQIDVLQQYFESEDGSALMNELAESLELTQEDLSAIYGTANTFRKSYFVALLSNISTAREAAEAASDSEGYSQEENIKYLSTYEAKLNQLKAQWQELANDEQGILAIKKLLLDIASGILNIIDWGGGIVNVLQAIIPALTTITLLLKFDKLQKGIEGILKGLQTFRNGIKTLPTLIGGATTALKGMNVAAAGTETALYGVSSAMATATLGISLLITIIMQAISWINKLVSDAAEERQETIQAGLEAKSSMEALMSLHDTLNSEEKGTDSYTNAIQKMSEALGLSADSFEKSGLSAEEYAAQLENLYEIKLKSYELDARNGWQTAADEAEQNWFERGIVNSFSGIPSYLKDFLTATDLQTEEGMEALIDSYNAIMEHRNELIEEQYNALLYGNDELYDDIQEEIDQIDEVMASSQGEKLLSAIESYNSYIAVSAKNAANEEVNATENAEEWKTALQEVANTLKIVENTTEDISNIQEAQNKLSEAALALDEARAKAKKDYLTSVLDEYINGLETEQKYQEILLKIEEERRDLVIERTQEYLDSLEEETDLEEKLLAVEEAREALKKAEEQRTVRIYNQSTGMWEWQADKKEIEDAEEELESAQSELDEFLKSEAWEEISEAITNGEGTQENIQAILDKWIPQSGSGALVSWGKNLAETINKATKESANATVDSIQDLEDYFKELALEEIKEQIENGTLTAASIENILERTLAVTGSDALYQWATGLSKVMTNAVNGKIPVTAEITNAQEAFSSAQKEYQNVLVDSLISEMLAADSQEEAQKIYNERLQHYKDLGMSSSSLNSVRETITKTFPPAGDETGSQPSLSKPTIYDLSQYTNQSQIKKMLSTLSGYAKQLIDYPTDMTNTVLPKKFDDAVKDFMLQTSDGGSRHFLIGQSDYKTKNWGYADYQDYVVQTLRKYVSSTSEYSPYINPIATIIEALSKNPGFLEKYPYYLYDNGGILNGVGGIKATNSPETVLGPELTAKLLEPKTNSEFKAFADSLGLVFSHARDLNTISSAVKNVIYNGNTGETIHADYIINGITIDKSVAEKYTVAELLETAAFLQ